MAIEMGGETSATATPTGDGTDFRRRSLGYQVNHLARLLEQSLRHEIEPLGVVPGQFAQILALFEQEPLTQRELCERVRIEQSTMAYTLQRMERDGLVERVADPDDRRRVQIRLTEHARRNRRALIDAARTVNERATLDVDPRRLDAVMHTIEQMIENLESADQRRD